MRTSSICVLVMCAVPLAAADPELTTEQRAALSTEAAKLERESRQLYERGQARDAAALLQQVLSIKDRLYPAGHLQIAVTRNNLAAALHDAGSLKEALGAYQQALADLRKLFPGGDANTSNTLGNIGSVLIDLGSPEKALPYFEEALGLARKLFPDANHPEGHEKVALGLNNMAFALQTLGAYEKALPYYEQALVMNRKLYPESKYPDGSPSLATNLNNLGGLLEDMGEYQKARVYFEQALVMTRKLCPESEFPDGHPQLALALNNMGGILSELREPKLALPYYEQTLTMRRKMYPPSKYGLGHPELAQSLLNLGSAFAGTQQWDRARSAFEEALAMNRRLYPATYFPEGHPAIVTNLVNLSGLLERLKVRDEARRMLEEAAGMSVRLTERLIRLSSAAESLSYMSNQVNATDAYLSLTSRGFGDPTVAYSFIWRKKAVVTRVLEQRHAAARAAGSRSAAKLARVKEIHRLTEQVLHDRRRKPADRDKALADLAEERDRLERELAAELPVLASWLNHEAMQPKDLVAVLPAHSAFVDFVTYVNFAQGDDLANQRGTLAYMAFVMAPGQPVQMVDLGDAGPIAVAVRAWREAIERQVASPAALELSNRVWKPVAKHLPNGTKTIFLSPGGHFAQLPWAALPIGDHRVLLEEYILATVPHGPFLLEQLKSPRRYDGPETALTVGDLQYNPLWPALPATRVELNALAELAPSPATTLSGSSATVANLTELMPRMRYAHLATHGQFQIDEYIADKKRDNESKLKWEEGQGQQPRRTAAKNPLGYVGLVLSRGETMSALSILDLNLENLKLATLSACETGLGEIGGGEGVQGLQRAFHLAGCPNVVVSLWKVNDVATAALMAKFYHEHWVNKKPPVEALREAQLMIYRHPEMIPDLSGERGAPKLKEAVAARSEVKPMRERVADTKLWAAFVLSGVGR